MKSKFFKKPDPDLEEKESGDEAEVSSGGPSIAAAKKGKVLVVLASTVLITVVIYFMFFKTAEKPKEKLEEVAISNTPIQNASVAPSEDKKSLFELEQKGEEKKLKNDVDVLDKPKTPDVPKLPELSEDSLQDQKLTAAELIEKPITPPLDQQVVAAAADQSKATPQLPEVPIQNVQNNQQQNSGQQMSGADQAKADLKITDPKYAPIIVVAGSSAPALGVGYDKNIISLNDDAIRKLEKSAISVKTTFVDGRTNVVAQGKMLTAVLETAINTEAPGSVRAIVSHDVYGEAGSEVLISRGSRLFGTYSSQILRGQGRVQITWSRLIRPDGVDLAISSSASDQFGRAGIPGEVDNKYAATISNSILTSILAVGGVALAQSLIGGNDQANTSTVNPQQGTVTTTGNASTQAVYNVSKTITDTVSRVINDSIDVTPTIQVPQGTRVTVIVNADMNIPSMRKR